MRRPILIREIRPDDLHGVFVLGSELFTPGDDPDMRLQWNEPTLAGVLSEDMARSFVAAGKKAIEGFLIGRIEGAGKARTSAEILWTGARGQEAGTIQTDLYHAFVNSLPDTVSRIRVALPGSNSEMMDFWKKFGFTDSKHVVTMENFFRKNS